jgi:energy coupling factor transporter S component ThiW
LYSKSQLKWEIMEARSTHMKKMALAAVFSALGVVIAPFFWFPFLGTRAYPGQHMINALAGVLLGPLWAAVVAIFTGIIRNAFGIGTLYAFPGGIPGGVVVGIFYWLLRKFKKTGKVPLLSALFEPVGTLFIGATVSIYLIAPWLGTQKLLSLLEGGPLTALLLLWSGWAVSCVPGSVLGFIILLTLDRAKITRKTLFGER